MRPSDFQNRIRLSSCLFSPRWSLAGKFTHLDRQIFFYVRSSKSVTADDNSSESCRVCVLQELKDRKTCLLKIRDPPLRTTADCDGDSSSPRQEELNSSRGAQHGRYDFACHIFSTQAQRRELDKSTGRYYTASYFRPGLMCTPWLCEFFPYCSLDHRSEFRLHMHGLSLIAHT